MPTIQTKIINSWPTSWAAIFIWYISCVFVSCNFIFWLVFNLHKNTCKIKRNLYFSLELFCKRAKWFMDDTYYSLDTSFQLWKYKNNILRRTCWSSIRKNCRNANVFKHGHRSIPQAKTRLLKRFSRG